jgi:hypothetical protein
MVRDLLDKDSQTAHAPEGDGAQGGGTADGADVGAPIRLHPRRVVLRRNPLHETGPKAQRFAPLSEVEEEPEVVQPPKRRRRRRVFNAKHVLLATTVGFLFLFPKWAMFAAGFVILMVVMAFYIAGANQIWRGVILAIHDLSDRDPARAARFRKGLDAFACRWDQVLDWFPEGSMDRFYMPDFQALTIDEARNEQRLNERLAQLRGER